MRVLEGGMRRAVGAVAALTTAVSLAGCGAKTDTLEMHGDNQIRAGLRAADEGQSVVLHDPLIGSIYQYPILGGPTVFATIDTRGTDRDEKPAAVAISAGCIYDVFNENALLDKPDELEGGSVKKWDPEHRVDRIDAQVIFSYESRQWPFRKEQEAAITVKTVTFNGETTECEQLIGLRNAAKTARGLIE
jgi:hypothetical protein